MSGSIFEDFETVREYRIPATAFSLLYTIARETVSIIDLRDQRGQRSAEALRVHAQELRARYGAERERRQYGWRGGDNAALQKVGSARRIRVYRSKYFSNIVEQDHRATTHRKQKLQDDVAAGSSMSRLNQPRKRWVRRLDNILSRRYQCSMTDLSTHPLEALSLNEAARPKAPTVPEATDLHRQQGRQLAAIHRHYLMEMAQIGAVLARIEAKDAPPEHLKRIVLSLDMSENLRVFGSLCGRECQVLKFHHDIEGADMFPRVEAAGGGRFRDVVAKLKTEHEVVHELIIRLDRAADALTDEPSEENFAHAAATFRKLEEIVRSHFGYEETELAEAIGYYLGTI